ncbi:MAG TPA: class I SAM-dependent methyltransferase [Acidimicrobiales bacterium]|nr:class I SAM-dependent methyltransferase [Acidimicrobiales bacterium]
MPTPTDPGHVAENRRQWDADAPNWVARGERNWAQDEPAWGQWDVPESVLGMFPADLAGLDAIELGCGTGYVGGWMARRGARVVGIDNSAAQLATARRLAASHGVTLALVHGDAEAVPAPDACFDFAVSEYGAAIWCDPEVWIPEAHRLLRPGGRLRFLGTSPLSMLCAPLDGSLPVGDRLVRPYFGMHRFDWREVEVDPGGVEFNLTISAWLALFRSVGFQVEDYVELGAPGPGSQVSGTTTADWAHRWPSEQVWKLRKLSP